MTSLSLKLLLIMNRQNLSFYSIGSDLIRTVRIGTTNQNSEQFGSGQLDQSERLYFVADARHSGTTGCALAQAGIRHIFLSCWDSTTPGLYVTFFRLLELVELMSTPNKKVSADELQVDQAGQTQQ
jgi:hypothetical protein